MESEPNKVIKNTGNLVRISATHVTIQDVEQSSRVSGSSTIMHRLFGKLFKQVSYGRQTLPGEVNIPVTEIDHISIKMNPKVASNGRRSH